jgi:hypothetical protein
VNLKTRVVDFVTNLIV